PGAALPGVVDRGMGERVHEAAAAVTFPNHEAGHRPDALVVPALVPAAPGDARGPQLRVRRPRLHGDPAGRLAVDVDHQTAGGRRSGSPQAVWARSIAVR